MIRRTHSRSARAYVPVIAFLLAFAALLLVVSDRFLLPALRAARDVDPTGRKHMAAIATLVLMVVLFCLLVLLLMAFRPSRFLFPLKTPPRTRTRYIDAWQESARRIDLPPKDADPDKAH